MTTVSRPWVGLIPKVMGLGYSILLWPLVPLRSVMSADSVPVSRAFEVRWTEIRDEVRAALDERPAPPFRRALPQPLIRTDSWGALIVRLYGADVGANHRRLPVMASILDEHPDVVTAIVTVLEPDAKVSWHVGILKCVLRCHIPLEVPPGDVGLQVGRRRLRWTEGRALVFDDTFPHRVWNGTAEARVVLLLDVVRPMRWASLERVNQRIIARVGGGRAFQEVVAVADAHAAGRGDGQVAGRSA